MDDRTAGWAMALALAGALIALADRGRRADALAMAALLLLYLVALAMASWLLDGGQRMWAPVIAGAAVWLTVQPLLAVGRLTRSEVGLVPVHAAATRSAFGVTVAALLANAVIVKLRGPGAVDITAALVTTVIIAAVVEELVMRGVLLALADRASAPRWDLAGARVGLGGVLLTLAFVALHGLRPGLLAGVLPASLLYLWLRARTGSVLAPIIAHVGWNVSVVVLHA